MTPKSKIMFVETKKEIDRLAFEYLVRAMEFKDILVSVVFFAFVIVIIMEFSPKVKSKPLSFVLQWAGKRMNQDLEADMQGLKNHLKGIDIGMQSMDREIKESIADRMRNNILNFDESLRQGVNPSEQAFLRILRYISEYHKYCRTNNIENGVIDMASEYIEDEFKSRYRKG